MSESPAFAIEGRVQHKTLRLARLAFQSEIKSVIKDATGQDGNREYDYATLPNLLDYALPIAAKHGLLIEQYNCEEKIYNERTKKDGTAEIFEKIYVSTQRGIRTVLRHADSEEVAENILWYDKPPESLKKLGGEITYLRRYSVTTVFMLSAEDDDANTPNAKKKNPQGDPDPESRKPAGKAAEQKKPPVDQPPADAKKRTDAEIRKEFADLGLDTAEVKKALESVNISTMAKSIEFRRKFQTTKEMLEAINGGMP